MFHSPLGSLIGRFIFVHIPVPHALFSLNPSSNPCPSLMVPSYPTLRKDFPVGIPVISPLRID